MNSRWKISGLAALMLAVGVLLGMNLFGPALGVAQPPQKSQRYSVVHTEGTNLIVTDNQSNTLYFYTVDQGAEPGADLKLRGSLDLDRIGDEVLKPKLLKKEK